MVLMKSIPRVALAVLNPVILTLSVLSALLSVTPDASVDQAMADEGTPASPDISALQDLLENKSSYNLPDNKEYLLLFKQYYYEKHLIKMFSSMKYLVLSSLLSASVKTLLVLRQHIFNTVFLTYHT